MSNYVYKSTLSYHDYLQAKSFEDSISEIITHDISGQTQELISSNNEIHQEQRQISNDLKNSISEGLESISFELQELNAAFRWGFSEILLTLRDINTSLSELIKIAKTPVQTWAYEQFEIARDAYRKGLYAEALEYLEHSINGHGSNVGYKLEFRFHYLKGLIHLGSYRNSSSSIVNLNKSVESFLNAARYSKSKDTSVAGWSYLAAGWAAYCQGKMEKALEYTNQALDYDNDLIEAYFQSAKILMHIGQPRLAISKLKYAIGKDRRYAAKAMADDDFRKYESDVRDLIYSVRQIKCEIAIDKLSEVKQILSKLFNVPDFTRNLNDNYNFDEVGRKLEEVEKLLEKNTLYSCIDAQTCIKKARDKFTLNVIRIKDDLDPEVSSIEKEIDLIKKQMKKTSLENNGVWNKIFLAWKRKSQKGKIKAKQEKLSELYREMDFRKVILSRINDFLDCELATLHGTESEELLEYKIKKMEELHSVAVKETIELRKKGML